MLLIRHAYAGKRKQWKGDDRIRPLTGYGYRQALAWVDLLADRPIDAIVSSPARRCMETVMPLALDRGLSLIVADGLSTEASLKEALRTLTSLGDADVVVCTHREVLEQLLPAAKADGARFRGGMKWPKGGGWDVAFESGRITGGTRVTPPRVVDVAS